MKKVILIAILMVTGLVAEVTTVIPYLGLINYSSGAAKSSKDKSLIGGVYASVGDLNYLTEISYARIDTTYKDRTTNNLVQNDIVLAYSKYYENHMFKGAFHYVDTSDTDLGDGYVVIAALGGYTIKQKSKYSYGLEGFYTYYNDGHNEDFTPKKISVFQLTPYVSFFNTISSEVKNNIELKLNYEYASNYLDKQYISYDISDTFYYKSFYTTLKLYGGEMKSGVKDGGMTVFNTMDLLKTGYSAALGYYLTPGLSFSGTYSINNFREYRKVEDASSSIYLLSLSYSY